MKITINGALDANATKNALQKQISKIKAIEEFCTNNKIKELYYKDAELEYNYKKVTRGGAVNE